MKSTSRFVFATILGTFLVSGLAGLLYQVVWTRYLALFLGHTSYAVVAVLVAFMGGLAMGNAWLGSKADTVSRPLRFYAWLEFGIGFYAIIFPNYYELMSRVYLSLVEATGVSGGALLALKFFFACVGIVPPAVLMGATLPALTRFVTRSLSELRGKVAALYAINSTGAVVGVVITDWWLIPALGLEPTVQVGAVLSLSIGLIAFVTSQRIGEGDELLGSTSIAVETSLETFSPAQLRIAIFSTGVSGFVAMLYEVVWTRMIGLMVGSSTHAYSIMLGTFIAGIACGGWVIYRWRGSIGTLKAFAWAEIALGATLLASVWFYELVPWWFTKLAENISRRPQSFPVYELLQVGVCFGIMFLPATCLGMTLPLASRVATVELSRTGRSVGRVFAINTLGTVLGALLTGLWLMPAFGLARTLALGIAMNLLIGFAVLNWDHPKRRNLTIAFGSAGAAILILVLGALLDVRWRKSLTLGIWRSDAPPKTLEEYRRAGEMLDLVFHRDGAGSTVGVLRGRLPDGGDFYALKVNAKTDASSAGDLSTQLMACHIPCLLHTNPVDTLVVGCGSGVTAGAMLHLPTVQRVDLVEISPDVVDAARQWFGPYHDKAFDNPRLKVFVEDAKSFLKTTKQTYDIIVTEPSNPWMAGVSAVFSKEYYEDCLARLKPGGLCAQWLQDYETDDATVDMVVATFSSVFPYSGIWQTSRGDFLLVGSPVPVTFDLESTAKRLQEPLVSRDLRSIGIHGMTTFLAMQLIGFGDAILLVDPETRIHSDYNPKLEYAAQRAFFVRSRGKKYLGESEQRQPHPRTLLAEWLRTHPLTVEDCSRMVDFYDANGLPDHEVLRSILYRWLELQPKAGDPLRRLARLAGESTPLDAEVGRLSSRDDFRSPEALKDPRVLRQLTGMMIMTHRNQRSAFYVPPRKESEFYTRLAMERDPEHLRSHKLHLAEMAWDWGDDALCLSAGTEALDPAPRFGPSNFSHDPQAPRIVLSRLIELHLKRGDTNAAWRLAAEAKRQKFIGTGGSASLLRLDMLVRRMAADRNEALPD
jgi:spermidine synthase